MNLTGINLNFVFEVLKKYTNVHVQVLQVLTRNGVSFLENEICILNIKSIFAHRKYFLNTYSKT